MRLIAREIIHICQRNVCYMMYQKVHVLGSVYSIRIEAEGGEMILLPDVTLSYPRAKELFELLIRGQVTPTTALDVWEDWTFR